MSNFFRRLTKSAIVDRKDLYPKPAISSEDLPESFHISGDFNDDSKSPPEKPYGPDAEGDSDNYYYHSIRSREKTPVKRKKRNENGSLSDSTHQMDDKESTKLGSIEISTDNSSAEVPKSLSSASYFSEIIASLRRSILQESRAAKKMEETSTKQISPMSDNQVQNNLTRAASSIEEDGHQHATPFRSPHLLVPENRNKHPDQVERVVTINIGRIEVHASPTTEKHFQRRRSPLKFPPVSLNEYLQKRSDTKP